MLSRDDGGKDVGNAGSERTDAASTVVCCPCALRSRARSGIASAAACASVCGSGRLTCRGAARCRRGVDARVDVGAVGVVIRGDVVTGADNADVPLDGAGAGCVELADGFGFGCDVDDVAVDEW